MCYMLASSDCSKMLTMRFVNYSEAKNIISVYNNLNILIYLAEQYVLY